MSETDYIITIDIIGIFSGFFQGNKRLFVPYDYYEFLKSNNVKLCLSNNPIEYRGVVKEYSEIINPPYNILKIVAIFKCKSDHIRYKLKFG